MGSMRTPEMEKKYSEYQKAENFSKKCTLCDKATAIQEFKFWKISEVMFPWDRIAKAQHMIIPKRHIKYEELKEEEKEEYEAIKNDYIEKNYELIAEATNKRKSIPGHFHLHLIIIKD